MRHTAFWGGAIGSLIAYDVVCARRGDGSTLSSVLRGHLTTHQRQGLFVAGWMGLTIWFVPHILRPALRDAAHEACLVCSHLAPRLPIPGA